MWTVFYDDRPPIDNVHTSNIETLPARGVQVIVQLHASAGWHTVTGTDYYTWDLGRWWGVDKFGLYDYLIQPGWKKVLFGRYILDTEYESLMRQASALLQVKKTNKPIGER